MSFNYQTNQYEGFIYLITNSVNGMRYVGQTRRDIQSRIVNHKSTSKKRSYKNEYLYFDVQKYRWDSFIISEIEKICCNTLDELKEILDKKEIFYIDKYNCIYPNGYNIQTGGITAPVKETKVYQFDKLGNFIKEYKSITEASKETNTDKSGIHACISGRRATAGGFIWSKDKNIHLANVEMKQKVVNVYSLNRKYLMQFNSPVDAALSVFNDKNKIHGISKCLNGDTKTAYGYIWEYANKGVAI